MTTPHYDLLGGPAPPPPTAEPTDIAEAKDMLRAISAGEVDAFVVSDGAAGQRVFTLSTADRPYRIFVENMRDGAATISSSGIVLYANQRLAELLARPRETLVGASVATFLAGDVPFSAETLRGPDRHGATLELDLVDGNGRLVPVLAGISALQTDGDDLVCLTFTDLSDHKAQHSEITRLGLAQDARMIELQEAQNALIVAATHDGLTGLPNRTLVVDRIDQALAHAGRSGRCTAVLFIDLDRFKDVNDTRGHAAGDAVLRRFADRLVGLLRPMDTVARLGGDEFVVLAPDIENRFEAVEVSSRLATELCRPRTKADDEDRVTASIGIAVSVAGEGTAETLLDEADTAMYKAKSLGGARAEVFGAALGRETQRRAGAQRMLQEALDDGRVIAHYQPIVDLPSGCVAGLEGLARVVQHDGSLLHPSAFIPVAEVSGLVVSLGEQLLAIACAEAQQWQRLNADTAPVTVAVNLSARQFERGNLPAIVHETLERTGLDPHRLHLELTETAIIDLQPDILQQLGRMRQLGIEIGLDDFGTGYGSLTHLRRLPLTFVKIDQSFVQGLGADHEDDRIVSAVVELAANLGLRSIAEGVETSDQLDRLVQLGCDQAQGYLFDRPLPPEDVPALIRGEGT